MPELQNKNEELAFNDSVKVNDNGEAILGRLEGPCADFISPTRNGRKYDESLWEKVFNDEIIKEYFECGGIPGELDHPTDRQETCSEKIAIMMPKPPKKNKEGQLIATFDILNTPCGKIAYTLAKYGYKLGISSRGSGDTYTDIDGTERVDEDTYDFQGFDLVLLPAVKSARLKMVESLNTNKGSFKKALCEALDNASVEDRKTMEETLNNLKIDYSPEKVNNKATNEKESATNDGDNLVNELQEALKHNQQLENRIKALHEKLSVCYAKEVEQNEAIDRYKRSISALAPFSKQNKILESKIVKLEQDVFTRDEQIKSQEKTIKIINENSAKGKNRAKALDEDLTNKSGQINDLQKKINTLTESINTIKAQSKNSQKELLENIEELKKDSTIKSNEFNRKIAKSNKLVERYKGIAKSAVDRYIDSQAVRLGINRNEITNRLSENFSFNEIDKVCDSLQDYKINISKLPFDINDRKSVKMNITESIEPIKPANRFDDTVDDQLKSLAGFIIKK